MAKLDGPYWDADTHMELPYHEGIWGEEMPTDPAIDNVANDMHQAMVALIAELVENGTLQTYEKEEI
jgi:hypothetical protein